MFFYKHNVYKHMKTNIFRKFKLYILLFWLPGIFDKFIIFSFDKFINMIMKFHNYFIILLSGMRYLL